MVPSLTLTTLRRCGAVLALIAAIAVGHARASAQAPAVDHASLLNMLLDRANTTAPGTYVVTPTTVTPDTTALPLVIQTDVMRGAEQMVRAALAVGGTVPHPFVARMKIISAPASPGSAPLVVGDAAGTGPAGTLRIVREFSLAPGEYDVHTAVGHARGGSEAVVTLAKVHVTIPDVWRGPLAVTPLVVGDAVAEAKRAPGTRPFEFEPTLLTPTATNRFSQNGSVHVAFRIYNWTPDDNARPDMAVEYVFYQRTERGERFFNKIKPQQLNSNTVGSGFDPSDGAVTAGVTVPLSSFPFGDFDLVVRVNDKRNNQKTERRAGFAVTP